MRHRRPTTPRLVRYGRLIGPGLGSRGRHAPSLMRTMRHRGHRAPNLCREHCANHGRSSAGDADYIGCDAADERCAAADGRRSPRLVLLTASRAAIINWLTAMFVMPTRCPCICGDNARGARALTPLLDVPEKDHMLLLHPPSSC